MKRKEYTIESSKVFEDKNIAICSDFHFNQKTPAKKMEEVLDILQDIKPTHIVIPGDLYDVETLGITGLYCGYYDNPDIACFIANATDIADVFYVKGDSEQGSPFLPYDLYNNYNPRFHLLCERNQDGKYRFFSNGGINIAGINPPLDFYSMSEKTKALRLYQDYQRYLEKLSKYCGSQDFNVLLCHDPIIARTLQYYNPRLNFDLVISGHNHGGMWPYWMRPFLEMAESPMDSYYPTYTKGIIDIDDNEKMIVSEGITKYDSNCRFQVLENFHQGTVENVRVLKK